MVSAHTDTLGIPLHLQVVSEAAGKIQQKTNSVWADPSANSGNLFRWVDGQGQVIAVQIVHPSDFGNTAIDGSSLRCDLFPEPLEKGVLRRGRIRCYFGAITDPVIEQLYSEFLDAPLPLTT